MVAYVWEEGEPAAVSGADMNSASSVAGSVRKLIYLLVLTVIVFADLSAASLFPGQLYRAGLGSSDVAVGDFNRDGLMDLVVTDGSSDRIMVRPGLGGGKVGDERFFDAGDDPGAVVVADVDGDGNQDLAVANRRSDDISILLGSGDGRFAAQQRFPVGITPTSIVADDFDNDGRPDLAISNHDSDDISILLGNGDGTFRPEMRFDSGGVGPVAIEAGDFNEDGNRDLVLTHVSVGQDVVVHLGSGDGSFVVGDPIASGRNNYVVVADFDGDGHQDVAVEKFTRPDFESGQVLVFRGNGDGSFQPAMPFNTIQFPAGLAVGDLNGDGTPDLVTGDIFDAILGPATGKGLLSIFLGNGDGTFTKLFRRIPGHGRWSLVLDDFDSDGHEDLVRLNLGTHDVGILLGTGDGRFETEPRFPVRPGPMDVSVGDLDDDGKQDLVAVSRGSDDVSVLLGKGDGDFETGVRFGAGVDPFGVTQGDFNGDGRQDVAVANEGTNDISLLLGNGDGSLAPETRFATGNSPRAVVTADFNRDGRPDLATADFFSQGVSVLLGKGDGTFETAIGYAAGSNPRSLAVGDFNNDLREDLAVANTNSRDVSILIGNGDGVFLTQPPVPVGRAHDVAVGDFNDDFRQDLAVTDFDEGEISVLIGNGDGSFASEVRYEVGGEPRFLDVSDLDRDGRADLVVSNHDTEVVSVLFGRGDGTFEPDRRFGTGPNPQSVAVGDFNGDDRADLVVAMLSGLSVLLNEHTADNFPPTAGAGVDTITECVSPAGATVTLDGSGSTDPDSTPGTNDDIVLFEWFEDFATSSENSLGTGELLEVVLAPGAHEITLRVTDHSDAWDTDRTMQMIVDSTPPRLSLSVAPEVLWPPNHRLVPVEAMVTASDTCGSASVVLASVSSSEPDNAPDPGDGNTDGDIDEIEPGTPDFMFLLRAERTGGGDGRIYTITYMALDEFENAVEAVATVAVPHDQNGSVDPIAVVASNSETGTVLEWSAVPGAASYNVIRGRLARLHDRSSQIHLGPVNCIEAGSFDTDTFGWEDSESPDPGEVWFYLVEYVDDDRSGYGTETASKPRITGAGDCH